MLNLSSAVSRLGHEVQFALACEAPVAPDASMAAHFGSRLHVLAYRPRRGVHWAIERLWRRLQKRLGREAGFRWSLDAWYDQQLTPMLRALHEQHRFDAVIVEYLYMSRALEAFDAGVRRIVDTHDRFTNRHRQFTAAAQDYKWFSVTEEDEHRGLARADAVIAIQSQEAQSFSALMKGQVSVETVGHMFDAALVVERTRTPTAVIVASSNPINVTGVNFFAQQVLPKVQRQLADFSVLLAGDVCAHVADVPGTIKLGRVADLLSAYRRAALAVNPVQSGTGLCIKSIEAMALGMPLVTTDSGARGLEAYTGRAFICVGSEDADAMAEAVLELLRNPAGADTMAREARAAALEFNDAQFAALARVLGAPTRRNG
ncbi:MAG: glycosyltransferase [Burkholderiaceae bacterium]|nr:glycosyltransferase [Burkholderiaceae bacterium]